MLRSAAWAIDWGADHLVTVHGGRASLRDPSGALIAHVPFDDVAIGAAVLGDGSIAIMGGTWSLGRHDPATGRTATTRITEHPADAIRSVAFAPAAERVFVCAGTDARLYGLDGKQQWWFHADSFHAHRSGAVGAGITRDATRLAIAYATQPGEPRPPGRGWLVIDLARTPPPPRRDMVSSADTAILDRHWLQTPDAPQPTLFAFSADGSRMIQASPQATAHVGPLRIQRRTGVAHALGQPGGAHALAIDARGVIAAYAYPEQPRRFRVDYLDPEPGGAPAIAILETLWIDPAVPDVAALAISPDSHSIACLATDGTLDIIVVP